jgi:myo-inositol 2-dehydrogenase/D-chiro-inositol 1-dehydrogenase
MRVGIVGTGTMGEVHAAAWRSTGAELIGCTSTNQEQAEALAGRYQMRVFADYTQLLSNVEIVDVCTPTAVHKTMVLQAAQAGKHVICEKPIALTTEDARAMISACRHAEVRFFVGMVVRFFPQYRLAKELVAQGRIGDLAVLRLKRVTYVPQKPPDNWYFDPASSGGMVRDLMIHDFDYCRWLAGEVDRVYARGDKTGIGSAQYVQAILRFRSGTMALVEGGWAYPPGVFRTGLDLAGTKGLIEWNSDQPSPLVSFFASQPSDAASVGLPMSGLSEDPYTMQIRHAYQAIQTGSDFGVNAEDALEALRISGAVEESLSTGKPIEL